MRTTENNINAAILQEFKKCGGNLELLATEYQKLQIKHQELEVKYRTEVQQLTKQIKNQKLKL